MTILGETADLFFLLQSRRGSKNSQAKGLVSEFALAISKGMKTEDIASVIHPHPTFSEMIAEACR